MRPNRLRRLLILAAFGAIAAGSGLGTGIARATPDAAIDRYTALEWHVVCDALTENPSLTTVTALFRAIISDTDFTVEETAKVVVQSVQVFCPENTHVLQRFVDVYGGPQSTGGAIGGPYAAGSSEFKQGYIA